MLTTGAVRLMNGVFPGLQVPVASLPTQPSILSDRATPPCGRASRSSSWRVDPALRQCLPTKIKGPSGVDPPVRLAGAGRSRVRCFLCGLSVPALGSTSRLSQRRFPRFQAFFRRPGPYETPRPSLRLGLPTFPLRVRCTFRLEAPVRLVQEIGRAHV